MAEEKKQVTTDLVIIGGGIAGLTAAIYAVRAGKQAMILEAKAYGGQIVNTPDIENYPGFAHISGFDFATKVFEQATALGAETVFEKAVKITPHDGIFTVTTNKADHDGKTVIIATGSENRKLGLPDEDRLVGRGVSYCATCDGAFFRGKTVAVVGGGNTALEDALYLSELAKTVYLIHRRDEFRGAEATAEQLRGRENVKFVLNSTVTALHAEKRLKSITVKNKNGDETELEVNGLFVAVGRIPENQNFAEVAELDGAGYVIAGEDCRTNTPGIFAAGDNRVKEVRQLVTAASDGAAAATEAVKYLNSNR